MASNAKLSVVLKADEKVVAQSDDAALWQRVFGVIHGTSNIELVGSVISGKREHGDQQEETGEIPPIDKVVARFAKSLGLTEAVVQGALSPSMEAPYLQLAPHNWEAFKKNIPKRGTGSISHIGFAGTALALWIKEAKVEVPATQALATKVLDTIGARDPNPSRGIKNTVWLLPRAGGTILVNPAEISQAQKIVKAYCLKKPVDSES